MYSVRGGKGITRYLVVQKNLVQAMLDVRLVLSPCSDVVETVDLKKMSMNPHKHYI